MPKLKPEVQQARSERILDAAETCFARTGFHRTTMHDICKEALIAGICERDRGEFAERFDALAAAPDFLEALRALGEQYFLEEPAHNHRMCIEIGLESTRNPRIGEIHQRIDRYVLESFQALFQKMKDEGRIAPALDIPTVARAFMVVADGMFWRRAVDPGFDPKAVMPAVLELMRTLLNPVAGPVPTPTPDNNNQTTQ